MVFFLVMILLGAVYAQEEKSLTTSEYVPPKASMIVDPCGTRNPCKVTNGQCGDTNVCQSCCRKWKYRDGYCYFDGGLCLCQCINSALPSFK
jgi:hypothetical protein